VTHGAARLLTLDLTTLQHECAIPASWTPTSRLVHELTWDEIKTCSTRHHIKPKRQMSVRQWRRADLSPSSLTRCLQPQGATTSVQQRPMGLDSPEQRSCAPPEPACATVYLQFDGIGQRGNSHRKVGNLFDVKAGRPSTTCTKRRSKSFGEPHHQRINNEQGGPHHPVRLTIQDDSFLSFQPVALPAATRRSATTPIAQRYTAQPHGGTT